LYSISISAQTELFSKCPKKAKVKSYIITATKEKSKMLNDITFNIEFKKSKIEKERVYYISFGSFRTSFEQVKFHTDSILYYDEFQKKFMLLFVLNKNSIGDTVRINNFGMIKNHSSTLEGVYYYSNIGDSVYSYNLKRLDNIVVNGKTVTTTAIEEYYFFHKIGISKKHGFVWVKYELFGVVYEFRFY
jgi:hypothetical protein